MSLIAGARTPTALGPRGAPIVHLRAQITSGAPLSSPSSQTAGKKESPKLTVRITLVITLLIKLRLISQLLRRDDTRQTCRGATKCRDALFLIFSEGFVRTFVLCLNRNKQQIELNRTRAAQR